MAAAVLLLGAGGLLYVRPAFATNLWGANYFPNVPLITQDGTTVHLYDDLLKGKAVAINLIYTSCKDECPLETARLVQVQRLLGERVGKDIFFYSISIDPKRDTPAVLKAYAEKFGVGPGWLFLTGNETTSSSSPRSWVVPSERHGHSGRPPAHSDDRQRADRPVDAELGGGQSEVLGHDDQRLHGLAAPAVRAALHGGAAPLAQRRCPALPEPVQRLPYYRQRRRGGARPGGGDHPTRPQLAGSVSEGPGPNARGEGPDRHGPVGQYKDLTMPNLHLSDGEIATVLAYLEAQMPPSRQQKDTRPCLPNDDMLTQDPAVPRVLDQ